MPSVRQYFADLDGTWKRPGWPVLTNVTFVDDVTMPVWKGTGHPDNNVGCYFGVARTTVSTITQADDKVHQNLNITGQVTLTARRQKFINCRGTFSSTGSNAGGVFYQMASATNGQQTVFERCEIEPSVPHDRYNGVYGHDFKLYRCAIAKVVDGTGIYNSTGSNANVEISASWLGYCSWVIDDYTPSRANGHSDLTGTHNDVGAQHGSGTNVHIHGCFLQGAKYNIVNPDNVTLDANYMEYTIANGNGIDVMSESNATEKMGPWSGQATLTQHQAYYHVGQVEVDHNWVWNFNHGIKFQSTRAAAVGPEYVTGRSEVLDILVHDNIFGGRWKNWGGTHKYYPFRYDSNCTVNGVRRTGGGTFTDDANNRWAADANLIATTYGDNGALIAGNPVRQRVDLVDTPY